MSPFEQMTYNFNKALLERKSPLTESQLQSECVIQFSQAHPELKGNLIGYFANADNKIKGAINNSLGLVKNCSDLLYIKNGELIGLELKIPNSRHDRIHLCGQSLWLLKTPKIGWFVDSLEMFWQIINGGSGIDPQIVLDNCLRIKTTTVEWNKVKY